MSKFTWGDNIEFLDNRRGSYMKGDTGIIEAIGSNFYVVDLTRGNRTVFANEQQIRLVPSNQHPTNVKCECGAHKVYGENCSKRLHSDWCSLYKD